MENAEVSTRTDKEKAEFLEFAQRLAARLKGARIKAGFKTTNEMEAETGFKRTTLNKWEIPKDCNPTVSLLLLFASACKTDLAELFSVFGDQAALKKTRKANKALRDDLLSFIDDPSLHEDLEYFIRTTKRRIKERR